MSIDGTSSQSRSAISTSRSVGAPKVRPFDDGGLHGGNHVRMGVAENQRPPGADIIDVPLAIRVLYLRADALAEKAGGAADRAEGADRRIDAAGNVALGALEQLLVA